MNIQARYIDWVDQRLSYAGIFTTKNEGRIDLVKWLDELLAWSLDDEGIVRMLLNQAVEKKEILYSLVDDVKRISKRKKKR